MDGMKKRFTIVVVVAMVLVGVLLAVFVLQNKYILNEFSKTEEYEIEPESYYLGGFIGVVSVQEVVLSSAGEISEEEDLKYQELLVKIFTDENTEENLLAWTEFTFNLEAFSDYYEDKELIDELSDNVDAVSLAMGIAVEMKMSTVDVWRSNGEISEEDYEEIYEMYKSAVMEPTQSKVDEFLEKFTEFSMDVMRSEYL